MPQFLIRKETVSGGKAVVEGDEAHHARDVLRLKAGDEIRLFDETGASYTGRIFASDKKRLTVEILQSRPAPEAPKVRAALCQALLPRDAMEWVIEKAVELGASEILPVEFERGIVKLEGKKRGLKEDHWQKHALAACKQSGRTRVPRVFGITSPSDLVLALDRTSDLLLLADTRKTKAGLESFLPPPAGVSRVLILIGPEGDFSDAEFDLFAKAGARSFSLGDTILRSETAALAALSITEHLLKETKS